MSNNVCGNCVNFQPKKGDKFFNCTFAKQAGVKYAMQVRADTRSCEAFSPLKQPPKPQPAPPPKRAEPQRVGLCPWGRLLLLAAIIILILLLAWGAYTCFSHGTTPAPTPTPTATPTSTPVQTPIIITPRPTPTPIPMIEAPVGTWVRVSNYLIQVTNVRSLTYFEAPQIQQAPAGSFFILLRVTVTNGSSSWIELPPSAFTIVDSFGLIYNAQPLPVFYNPGAWTGLVGPGGTASGDLWYTIADVSTGLQLTLTTPNAIIKFNLSL